MGNSVMLSILVWISSKRFCDNGIGIGGYFQPSEMKHM